MALLLVCPKLGFGQDSAKQIECSLHCGLNGALHSELLASRSAQNVFVIHKDVDDVNGRRHIYSPNRRWFSFWQWHIDTRPMFAIGMQEEWPLDSNIAIVENGNQNGSDCDGELGRINNVKQNRSKTTIARRY